MKARAARASADSEPVDSLVVRTGGPRRRRLSALDRQLIQALAAVIERRHAGAKSVVLYLLEGFASTRDRYDEAGR
jgi:hypothetical protein